MIDFRYLRLKTIFYNNFFFNLTYNLVKLGYFSIGFVLIPMSAKLEKFVRDLKKLRHSYLKQPLAVQAMSGDEIAGEAI